MTQRPNMTFRLGVDLKAPNSLVKRAHLTLELALDISCDFLLKNTQAK
jgi:hypothetical protein